jgi:hypothetical protein
MSAPLVQHTAVVPVAKRVIAPLIQRDYAAMTEAEAEAALRAIPSSKKEHVVSVVGWADMSWVERLKAAEQPPNAK